MNQEKDKYIQLISTTLNIFIIIVKHTIQWQKKKKLNN